MDWHERVSVIYAGDDTTDEDAIEVKKNKQEEGTETLKNA